MKLTVLLRLLVVSGLALSVSACGKDKKAEAVLLTYIPADSAYVVAATEAPSEKLTDQWLKRMQPIWPIYDAMLAPLIEIANQPVTAATDGDDDSSEQLAESSLMAVALNSEANAEMKEALLVSARIASELIKDLRHRDSSVKMSETGLAVPGLSAVYGVGMMPVARIELSSADAFRAWITKIEAGSATAFPTAKLGDQNYWHIGNDKLQLVFAIQDEQLVVTLFPAEADDVLRQRLLGITKPQGSIADTGELSKLMAAESYLPIAAGWIDFKRLLALYPADASVAAMGATFDDTPLPVLTDECRSDFNSMIDKAPRIIFGFSEFSAIQMKSHTRWQLAPHLAKDLVALLAAPTVTGGEHAGALVDVAINVPLRKLQAFALKQAEAIVAKPYECDSLDALNQAARDSLAKLSQMLPPPLSDITGLRLSLDSVILSPVGTTVPDVRGKLLIASTNPSFLAGLAQMTVPSLASLVVTADGQPVEVPTEGLPAPEGTTIPQLHVAMTDKALALSFGEREAAMLTDYVKASPGTQGDWMKTSFSDDLYTLQSEFLQHMQELMPESADGGLEAMNTTELNKFYASILKRIETDVSLSAKGIEFEQKVELKP